MASGHERRTNRSNTWPHRPAMQESKKNLAKGAPSTHGANPQRENALIAAGMCGRADPFERSSRDAG